MLLLFHWPLTWSLQLMFHRCLVFLVRFFLLRHFHLYLFSFQEDQSSAFLFFLLMFLVFLLILPFYLVLQHIFHTLLLLRFHLVFCLLFYMSFEYLNELRFWIYRMLLNCLVYQIPFRMIVLVYQHLDLRNIFHLIVVVDTLDLRLLACRRLLLFLLLLNLVLSFLLHSLLRLRYELLVYSYHFLEHRLK